MLKLLFIYFFIFLFSCTPSKQKFSVGEPQTVISHERMKQVEIVGIDASIYALNEGDHCKWFCTNRWKFLYSIGPRDNPFDSIVVKEGLFEGLPDPYADTKVGFSHDHLWGNISWIANVYCNPENGHILSFVHLEYVSKTRDGVYFRLGLAISKDGGKSFKWCGYIIEPDLSYETWLNDWRGGSNMGLANYIIKDGYFYMYYMDTRDMPDTSINGTAVARAKVEDVLMAAENLKIAPWHKYYNRKWDEQGMGGKFTPLNIEPLGFLHGDAAYNSYLDKYVLVTRDGKHKGKIGSILISFSKDGINWSDWQIIHKDNHLHDYPSIISMQSDNEVLGKSFWVYYKYFHTSILPDRDWHSNRWDRVLVTME